MQTHKIKPFPVILYDSLFWKRFLEWLRVVVLDRKYISEEDFNLLRICDQPDQVIEAVQKWYIRHEILGSKALER
jgi:predicted Rossmann-fold nucleotide-binding protein